MKQILGDMNHGRVVVRRHLREQVKQNSHFAQFLHEIVKDNTAFSTISILTNEHLFQSGGKLEDHFLPCGEYVHNLNDLHICC